MGDDPDAKGLSTEKPSTTPPWTPVYQPSTTHTVPCESSDVGLHCSFRPTSFELCRALFLLQFCNLNDLLRTYTVFIEYFPHNTRLL